MVTLLTTLSFALDEGLGCSAGVQHLDQLKSRTDDALHSRHVVSLYMRCRQSATGRRENQLARLDFRKPGDHPPSTTTLFAFVRRQEPPRNPIPSFAHALA